MNDISMTVIGNVVNDVEMRFTPSGEPVAKFRVAASTRRFDRVNERWMDGDTHYLSVSCWRGLAHNVVHTVWHKRVCRARFRGCGNHLSQRSSMPAFPVTIQGRD